MICHVFNDVGAVHGVGAFTSNLLPVIFRNSRNAVFYYSVSPVLLLPELRGG